MDIAGTVVLVTGGAGGIGSALAGAFAAAGAKAVIVVDRDDRASSVAAALPGGVGIGRRVDVTDEAEVVALVHSVEADLGAIDICCSNAGVAGAGGIEAPGECWQQLWDIHVMAHVYLARAVLPAMLERGRGYLVQTASAAGLLTNVGNAPYSVTKHATVALAEWLAITYGDRGIGVSCLCPQGVRTEMLLDNLDDAAGAAVVAAGGVLEPGVVAETVLDAIAAEEFFVLPHPEVAGYVQRKAADPDRWLRGMRRARSNLV